ncbi:uncharacterized protein LOC101207733 [Cucumis sativus]|uniref:Uncharacterized protein n=1 Tax=Cucumis sativus TaxID=3659 RepID=A0A0A0K8I3_CUCSA|nr:uncharacterized protein LOC101207733 [Cucumis sativus]KGN46025.1 hypothetical protein Csa_005228 [Cucumis sativus]
MENPDQDQQDPRSVPGVEDTTAMTIEFLRARLLSERSVSKSARQRADELAKRVAELEEQLKIVSLQRKMAEKATADVLAILEDNGASDISETLDSNSDHETEPKVEDGLAREDVSSGTVRRRNEHEEYSGSNIDTSPVLGGSLSWKGRNDSPHTREKYKKHSIRSRSSFTSIGSSSPKHQLGRSCRQIKRRDTRPLDGEQELKSDALVDSSEEIPSTSLEDSQNYSVNGHSILRDGYEVREKTRSSSSGVHNSVGNSDQDNDIDGYEKVDDMEKALKCQAQLIDQYEAMEKAQREWEEKFRENNNSTPDSCDPGNHSDITEERDEMRAQAPNLSNNPANEAKPQVAFDCDTRDLSQAQTNGLGPSMCAVDVEDLQDQNTNSISTSKSLEEFTFPMANVKQCQESQENSAQEPSCTSHLNHGLPERPLSSHGGINSYDQETPCSNNDLYALVPHEPPALDGVLEALKQAKLSLTKKIIKLPSVDGESESIDKSIGPLSIPKMGDRLEIPVGCAGLFRLPTDFAAEASSQANFLASSSQLRSPTHYPGEGAALSANHQIFPGHEMEDRSSFLRDSRLRSSGYRAGSGFTRDGFLTDHIPENRWKNPGQKHHFDQYFDAVQPSSYVHNYPPRPVSSNIHPNDTFLRTFPGRSTEMPPTNQYSFYDDQFRPNMYR